MNNDLKYALLIHKAIEDRINYLGSKILEEYGSFEECFKDPYFCVNKKLFLSISKDLEIRIKNVQKENPDKYFSYLLDNKISPIIKGDENYPKELLILEEIPYILYAKGKTEILKTLDKSIAIVGSRDSSDYGDTVAFEFGYELSKAGITIISGMAKGIDNMGHLGAMKALGNTIAVLGCGADVCYPKINKSLYDKLSLDGLILSEYVPGTSPLAYRFPKRNRIIAALSSGTIVVEGRLKSGALITARLSMELGKEVFVIPGNITNPGALGPISLAQDGAALIMSPGEVIRCFNISSKPELSSLESRVLKNINYCPTNYEDILKNFKSSEILLSEVLTNLQDLSLIEKLPGDFFRRI